MSKTVITKYTENSLDNIRESDFLSEKDLTELTGMMGELQNTFEKMRIWRTETEMRVSVLSDISHPTKASKYWQATLEQNVFFENLVTLSFEYRRNLVKIERLTKKIEKATDELDKKDLTIDLEEAMYTKLHHEKQSKERMRELKLWSTIKEELDDGSFDTDNINTDQLIGFTRSFVQEALMITENTAIEAKTNILSKMISSVRRCKELGIYDDAMSVFPEDVKKTVLAQLGISK